MADSFEKFHKLDGQVLDNRQCRCSSGLGEKGLIFENEKIEWFTTKQAAAYLGLTEGALRNMTSNGQVPYYKLKNRNRYLVAELRQLLLSQRKGA